MMSYRQRQELSQHWHILLFKICEASDVGSIEHIDRSAHALAEALGYGQAMKEACATTTDSRAYHRWKKKDAA